MSKNKNAVALAMFMALIIIGCNDDKKSSINKPDEIQSPLTSYEGVWAGLGNGIAIQIKKSSVTVYDYTKKTCAIKNNFEQLALAEAIFTKISPGVSGNGFSFIYPDGKEYEREEYIKQTLPEVCSQANNGDTFMPVFAFEHTWHLFNDYYPFMQQRNVNWQAQWNTYRPLVNETSSPEELFNILSQLVSPLDDGHIDITVATDTLDEEYSPALLKGWNIKASLLANEYNIDADDAFEHLAYNTLNNISERYGISEMTFNEENQLPLAWGKLEGNIGYINIAGMGYVPDDGSEPNLDEILTNVNLQMTTIVEELKDTEGMIIDVRFNGGGLEDISLVIASYFTDQKRLAFTKENYNLGNATPLKEWYIEPNSDITYAKPVVLLTAANTASAAEAFTLSMRALSQVTHMGETTQGIFSDSLSFNLTQGFSTSFPFQIYYSTNNVAYETLGIPPHINAPTTTLSGSSMGAQPAIHQALAYLGVDLSITQKKFTTQVELLMKSAGIPGFSVAWVDDKKMIGSQAFGVANIESQRLVTVNTPFNLGSISKTFIGTSAMQLVEQNKINLETKLADLAMQVQVNSPYFNGSDISLLQLATHTSGISEQSLAYGCGYYVEETKENLYAMFIDEFSTCPSPVNTNQSAFIDSLLNSNGELYSTEHFVDTQSNKKSNYSNVGAALAAEMLSVAANVPFKNWTENNIFTPLGMNNTHWFNQDFNDSQPQPASRYVYLDSENIELPEYALSTWADGGLKASAVDMAKYLLAIIGNGKFNNKRILKESSVSIMLNIELDESTLEGQRIFWVNDGFVFGHDGEDPGTSTNMVYDQYNKLGIILMQNLTDGEEGEGDDPHSKLIIKLTEKLQHLAYRRGLSIKAEKINISSSILIDSLK